MYKPEQLSGFLKSCGKFKVVTTDLKSLGLRKNPHIYTYTIGKWKYEDKQRIDRTNKDNGGIWVTSGFTNAKKLAKYMMDKYNQPTRIFLVSVGEVLYENSYRLKTDKVKLYEEILPQEEYELIQKEKMDSFMKTYKIDRIKRNRENTMNMKEWKDLTDLQKQEYKRFCDDKYGQTNTFSESGEPLYFDEKVNLRMASVVIQYLFGNLEPIF